MTSHLDDAQAQALADDALPEADREACCAHLACCEECQLVVDSYRALAGALDGLDAPEPPPGFTDAVMCCIDERERDRALGRRVSAAILGVACAAAAAVAVLAGGSAWAPALARAFDHLGDVVTAVTVASDVLSPLLRALRVQIALACLALAVPILFGLSRLVPRHAEVSA